MMGEYILSVIAIFMSVCILSFTSYRPSDRGIRLGVGVVLLAAVISPTLSMADELFSFDKSDTDIDFEYYGDRLEDSLALGIKRGIEERFGLGADTVKVSLGGFDERSVRAENIYVSLGAEAARIDPSRVRDYVNSMDLGKCEVSFSFD